MTDTSSDNDDSFEMEVENNNILSCKEFGCCFSDGLSHFEICGKRTKRTSILLGYK